MHGHRHIEVIIDSDGRTREQQIRAIQDGSQLRTPVEVMYTPTI